MESAIRRNNLFFGVEILLKKAANVSWRLINSRRGSLGGWSSFFDGF